MNLGTVIQWLVLIGAAVFIARRWGPQGLLTAAGVLALPFIIVGGMLLVVLGFFWLLTSNPEQTGLLIFIAGIFGAGATTTIIVIRH